ncbi:TPA: hypothetical protein ACNOIH_000398, partial [Klebsiella aerogenes]
DTINMLLFTPLLRKAIIEDNKKITSSIPVSLTGNSLEIYVAPRIDKNISPYIVNFSQLFF